MTGFGSVRWSDAMNQLILIALPTLPVLVTGAGEQARIASSNFSRPTSQPAHAASLYHSLENQVMFTCCIRYNIDPNKLAASFLARHETTCRSLPLAFPAWASKGHQTSPSPYSPFQV